MAENEDFIQISGWQGTKEDNDLHTIGESLKDLKDEVEGIKAKLSTVDIINEKVSVIKVLWFEES